MALRSLSSGTTGPDVKGIQEALNARGAVPKLQPDGKFGRQTEAAVRAFQSKQKLKDDGIVGRHTRKALFPVGVATVVVSGMKLQMPDFQAQAQDCAVEPFVARNFDLAFNKRLGCTGLSHVGLFPPNKAARASDPDSVSDSMPDWNFAIPPAPGQQPVTPLGFVYDHIELQPGAQFTFPFGGHRQDVFVLTMQSVYRRGPDDGSHVEADLGVQMGAPFSNPGGPWTFNPFIQLTDVDRFGVLGSFNYWQPYAQIGVQFSGPGNPLPSITGNLFPVNLGLDIGDLLTVNLGGGLAFTMDLQSGEVQAGLQVSSGITLKLGRPGGPF